MWGEIRPASADICHALVDSGTDLAQVGPNSADSGQHLLNAVEAGRIFPESYTALAQLGTTLVEHGPIRPTWVDIGPSLFDFGGRCGSFREKHGPKSAVVRPISANVGPNSTQILRLRQVRALFLTCVKGLNIGHHVRSGVARGPPRASRKLSRRSTLAQPEQFLSLFESPTCLWFPQLPHFQGGPEFQKRRNFGMPWSARAISVSGRHDDGATLRPKLCEETPFREFPERPTQSTV